MGQCLVGYATWGDNPSDMGQSNTEIGECTTNYTSYVKPTWGGSTPYNIATGAGRAVGALYVEGGEYGPTAEWQFLQGILGMTTATGTDYFADIGASMPQFVVQTNLHITSPTTSGQFGCNTGTGSGVGYVPLYWGIFRAPTIPIYSRAISGCQWGLSRTTLETQMSGPSMRITG